MRAEVWSIRAARVAARRILDFDYFGAKARQDERGEGPGERDCQIENSDSIKGFIQAYFSR